MTTTACRRAAPGASGVEVPRGGCDTWAVEGGPDRGSDGASGDGAPGDGAPGGGAPGDAALAARVAAGDAEALGALYDRYGPLCYRLALRVTASAGLAEDAVQEAFLALWQRGRYDHERGSLRSWLLALAHHKAVDAVRREAAIGRREATEARRGATRSDPGDEPETAVLAGLQAGAVRDALTELPPDQREALLLAYFAGHTQSEIATITGVPLGTVKTRTFAAMRKLQRLLSPSETPSREAAR